MFMENLTTTQKPVNDQLYWPMGDAKVGWIAGDDLTAVAAKVLAEGEDRHAGQNYFLSTDLLDGRGTAAALSRGLGREISAAVASPEGLEAALAAGRLGLPANIEAHYAASIVESARQIYDGRMAHLGSVTDTVARLLGRPPLTLEQWAKQNQAAFAVA
jgi:hypothetical protein